MSKSTDPALVPRPPHKITLGDREFEVPRLPLGVSAFVYPLCQRLSNAGLVERRHDPDFVLTREEMDDLIEVAFQLAHVADESLGTAEFLAMPVTPPELMAAFFLARLQCGGWRATEREGGDAAGETTGDARPPTSTSPESSPSSSATTGRRRSTG